MKNVFLNWDSLERLAFFNINFYGWEGSSCQCHYIEKSVLCVLFLLCSFSGKFCYFTSAPKRKIAVNIHENSSKMATKSNFDFANFRVNLILTNNTKHKTVCLVGNFVDLSETDRALVILEKTAFTGLSSLCSCEL